MIHIAAVCREHVFHITFPQDWKADNIHQLFSPFGMLTMTHVAHVHTRDVI